MALIFSSLFFCLKSGNYPDSKDFSLFSELLQAKEGENAQKSKEFLPKKKHGNPKEQGKEVK